MARPKVVHIKSNTLNKKPTTGQIDYGEIAVNYNSGNTFLAVKDSKNDIKVFTDKTTNDASYAPKSDFNELKQDVINNEQTTSAALNDVKGNITTINGKMVTGATMSSTATAPSVDSNVLTIPTVAGKPGTNAGFGTPIASVDSNTGIPAVTVTASGPDTAKVFDFEFKNLKGKDGTNGSDGRDGTSASITGATATVTTLDAGNDATVRVGNTGSEFSRGFKFTFGIPKGEKGEPGQTGPAGPSANAQISGGTCYLMGLTSTTGDIVSTKTNASCFMSGGSLYSQNKEVLTAVTIDNHYVPKDGIKSGGTDYYINSIQYDGKGHITTIETGSTGTLLSNYVTKTELENKKYITGVTSDNHYDPSKNTPFITSGDTFKYINAISFDSNGHVTNIQTANTSDFVSNDIEYKSLSAQVITNKDNIEALSGSVTAFSSSVVTNIEAINKNITTANTLYFIGKSSPANESLGTTNLFVASGAYISNSEFYGSAFYETSDERLKYFTSDVNVDFDKLKSIPKKYFMWKNREMNPTNIGTSAQKLQAVYPELVSESEGYLRVDYAKLSVIALAAVDKLHEENEELKERLKKIEEKLGL